MAFFDPDIWSSARWLRRAVLPCLLAAACCCLSAKAEPATPQPAPPAPVGGDSGNGRYSMTPVADGFLRLDTRTGQVSLCTTSAGQAQCRASADEWAALEAEIERLAKENAALKGQAPKTARDDEDRRFDRALDRAERFMRRMMQIFRDSSGKPPPTSL